MSGAEALAGVSLVCNVIQIVTFARDVIITYKSIEDNHSPDPRLAQMCEAVKVPYERLLEDTRGHVGPMEEEQQALVQGAQKCVERIEELSRMVSRLSVPANTSRTRKTLMVLGRSVSSLWRKKEVAALEKDLERYQALVDTHLLRHISGNVRSSETQNLRSFAELDDRLKKLLNSYNTDNETIKGFILAHTEETQACVKETGKRITAHVDHKLGVTELVIRSGLTALETSRLDEKTKAEQEERRKRVLESLYFPERNSRWNRIEENYPRTFRWALSIPGEPQSESGDDDSDEYDWGGYYMDEYDRDEFDMDEYESDQGNSQEDGSGGRNSQGDEDESERRSAPAFGSWLRSDSKLFWISGKPASGKSTLMKYIITNARTREHLQHWSLDVRLIHHFFWKPGNSMENSVDGMLCSLIYQILEGQPYLVEFIGRHGFDLAAKRSHHDWSSKELKDTLFRLLKEADTSFCIFLDGLDEAVEKLHRFDVKALLDGLTNLDSVKVCASGRPEPKFAKYFTEKDQLVIHDLTSEDIMKLVTSRLKHMQLDPDFRRSLARIVIDRAQGVFMWVILVLNSVQINIERETPEECLERVSRMAQDLHSLYKDMWSRATHHGIDRATATLYFNFVVKLRLVFFHESCDLLESLFEDSSPALFRKTKILDLAMVADDDFLTTFFEDFDSVTDEKLCDLMERTRKRVELGSAGLLECVPDRIAWYSESSGLQGIGVCDSDVVDFTHRTVFDFFTDSECGRDILLESPVTDREFFIRLLKSVMLRFRYFRPRCRNGYSDTVHGIDRFTGGVFEIVRLIGSYEAYDPEILATSTEMVGTLWGWHRKGYFNSADWEQQYHHRFDLSTELASPRFVEFVEALTAFHPRIAIGFIQQLGAADLSIALPVVLRSGTVTCRYGEWLHVVRGALFRLRQLRDAGMYAAQTDSSRDISLALSFFLRKLLFILHRCSSEPEESKHIPGILRNAEETMELFTELDISSHCWNRSFVISLYLDPWTESIKWKIDPVGPRDMVIVACNDLFLKQVLAGQEGLRGLQDLQQGPDCEPIFDVPLTYSFTEGGQCVWGKPSVSWAHELKHLLLQTLTGQRPFRSEEYQCEEQFGEIPSTHEVIDAEELERREKELFAELEGAQHFQHPWMPIHAG